MRHMPQVSTRATCLRREGWGTQLFSFPCLTFLLQGHLSHKRQVHTSQLLTFLIPFFHWCPQAWIRSQEALGLQPYTENDFPFLPSLEGFQMIFSLGCHPAPTYSNLPRKKRKGTRVCGYRSADKKRPQPPGFMGKAWGPVAH